MSQVHFLSQAPERLIAAAQWIAQQWQAGRYDAKENRLWVFAPKCDARGQSEAQKLDALLWTHDKRAFVPHCLAHAPWANATPIVIDVRTEGALPARCLLNLSDDLPPDYTRFAEVVEIVSQADTAGQAAARVRYQRYRSAGDVLRHAVFGKDI